MFSDDLTISVTDSKVDESESDNQYLNVVKHSNNVSSMTIKFDNPVMNWN